jgi:hypothetical protein
MNRTVNHPSLIRRCLPVLAVALLLPATVDAQVIDSPYRWVERAMNAGVFAGVISPTTGIVELGPQSGPVVGSRFSMRLSGPFTAELDVGYLPTSRAIVDTVRVGGEWQQIVVDGAPVEAPVQMLLAQLGLRFNVTGARTYHGLQPFLLLGGGAAVDLVRRPTEEEILPINARFRFGTSFAGQLGGGVEWFATERVALRADVRNVIWRIRYPEAFRIADQDNVIPANEWRSNHQLTAGISLYF